jgi:hypothetical protein
VIELWERDLEHTKKEDTMMEFAGLSAEAGTKVE